MVLIGMHRFASKCVHWKNLVKIRYHRARHRRAMLIIVEAIERYRGLERRYGADSRMLQVWLYLVGPKNDGMPILTNQMDKQLKFFTAKRQRDLDSLERATRHLEILNSRKSPELLAREIEEASALQKWYTKELQWFDYMLGIINRVY